MSAQSRIASGGILVAASLAALLAAGSAFAQNGTWSSLADEGSPSARREFGAVYDAVNQRYVVFSGFTNQQDYGYHLFNEVWLLTLGETPDWSHVEFTQDVPGQRHSPQWGYDAANNRILMFGGYGLHYESSLNYEYLNDVWQLSLNGTPAWSEIFPTGQPPSGRLAGSAVYDPMRERFVGFGGTIGEPVDTWVLNLAGQANWILLPAYGDTPNGGYGMTSIFDPVRDRMVIFGGSTSDYYYGVHRRVWELTLRDETAWNEITPPDSGPVARRSGTAIYDAKRDRMVIYGGWDNLDNGVSSFLGDVWAMSFDGTPTWTELAPAGTIPAGRDAMAAVYDPLGDRMVVFGGWSGVMMLGDTQFLDFGEPGLAASFQASASADPGVAHLEWDVDHATGTLGAVYRRTPGGMWTALAEVETDASGVVSYDDASIPNGGNFEYLLVVASERGEAFGGATAIQVPSVLGVDPTHVAFALNRVAPNPVTERFAVSFALPTSERAELELLDLAGRRVLSREVGSLGAGAHRVDLSRDGSVAPGVYFLRLSQGVRRATTRVVMSGR